MSLTTKAKSQFGAVWSNVKYCLVKAHEKYIGRGKKKRGARGSEARALSRARVSHALFVKGVSFTSKVYCRGGGSGESVEGAANPLPLPLSPL